MVAALFGKIVNTQWDAAARSASSILVDLLKSFGTHEGFHRAKPVCPFH